MGKIDEDIMIDIDILEDLLTGYIAGVTGNTLATTKKNRSGKF